MTDFAKLVMGADTRGLKEALKDLADLATGADKTENETKKLNKTLLALGAAGAAAATALAVGVKHAINTADEYAKLSQRLGIAVKDLGALAHAADLSGVSLESVAMGVQFLSRNMAESLQSATGAAAQSFKALNISVTDAKGNLRDSQDVLNDLADRFAAMPDGAQKTAFAMDLVGRGGAALIPLLNGGSEAMEEMRKEAEALGLVISKDTAKQAEEFNDNLSRVTAGLTGVFNIIATAVLPTLAELSENLVALTKEGVAFFRENLSTLGTVLEHALIAATSLAVFMAGKFAVSLVATAVPAITAAVGQTIALEMALGATSKASAIASAGVKLFSLALTGLKGALIATGIGAAVVLAGEFAALLIQLKMATGSWGEAFALVGGVIKGVFLDFQQWVETLVKGTGAAFKGLWEAIKASATGGDISAAFLKEFENIEFGASRTMEAIAKLRGAMNPTKTFSLDEANAALIGEGSKSNPDQGPAQSVLDKYKELTKTLTDQAAALGMTERAAAIYTAQQQLAEGSTAAMKERVGELAAALFDAQKAHDAAKATADSYKSTIEGLNESVRTQFDALTKTDKQIAIDNALKKVSGKLTEDMKKKITQQAVADYELGKVIEKRAKLEKAALDVKQDVMTNQEKLNEKVKEYAELLALGLINQAQFDKAVRNVEKSLNIDTRPIGERMWEGIRATFFDPFSEAADQMADKFAEQVDRMSQASERMANGKSTVDKIQGGLDVLSNIPGPIGQYAGAISKAISTVKAIVGLVKNVGKMLFGGKFETVGGGLQLQLGAGGVLGQNFENQHKSGGLFSGSKDRTIFSAVSGEQSSQFNAIYRGILDNATTAFSLFGMEANRDMMEQVRIAALNIKTSGEGALSEAEAQKAIENWFKQLDSAIVMAVGGESIQALLDLSIEGEAATETLIRLGNQLQTVNGLLDLVDVSMYAVGVDGAVMADALVKAAGGMDKLQAGVNSFFANFFTEEEQFTKLTEGLTATFSGLGLTLPATREGVRALVEGLDLTTEAGRAAFAAIMNAADGLNTYYTTLEGAADKAKEAAEAAADAANDAAKAAEDAANKARAERQAATDAALGMLRKSIDAEKAVKEKAYNESVQLIEAEARVQTDAANKALQAARNNLNVLQGEFNAIKSALTNATNNVGSNSRSGALAFIRAALQSGNLTGTGAAAQRAAQLDSSTFKSATDFKREQIRTVNLLGQLSDAGQSQIDYAQKTVEGIEKQIEAIKLSTAELIDAETLFYEQQIDILDNTLVNAENQLNVLRGINDGVLSVDAALKDFYSTIAAERSNGLPPPGIMAEGGKTSAPIDERIATTLEEIKKYTQSTAVSNAKIYNLDDRVYRESQEVV